MLRPNFMISRKTGNLVISVAFAAILLFCFAGVRRLSFFTGWSGEAKSGGSVQSAEAHTLAASYYSAKNGLKSTLMISNQGPNEMPTQVRLFNREGKQFDLPAMNLGAHEFRAIDLGQYAASDASFEEGSVQVEYQGRKMEMGGAVTIADAARSLLSDEELVEPAREFASSQLEGLWWQPRGGAEVSLAVSNTSSARLSVTVSATAGGRGDAPTLNLVLNAHETRILGAESSNDNERLVLRGNAGGISIRHSGAPGALIAYGFVQERSTGFSSVIDFSDPQRAKTARLDGAGLRIGNLQGKRLSQILVVRNISSEQVTISGRILCTLGNGTDEVVGLEEFQLGPGEMRRINLRPAITQQTRGRRVESAGLEIVYTGNPGAIIATAASMSPDEDQVFRVPMRDAAVQSSSTGIYPWSIDETSSSFVYIKNVTDSPKQFTMMISYEGGNYALGEVSVSGGKTVTYDIRKLRDSQKPDASGSVIPLQATGGKVHWSVRGPEIKSLIGRVEQADLVNGVSMTVACGLCCPDSYYDSWITPGSALSEVGNTSQFSLLRRDRDCFGFIKDPVQQFYSNWSCDNTSVATINSITGFATAVGIGSSWIRNPFSATVYTDEGSFCSESTSTADPAAKCIVAVVDLDIDGVSDANESTVGGLVVRNFDSNNAPRQRIIIQSAQNTDPGNIILTVSDTTKVRVFTVSSGGTQLSFNGVDNKFAFSSLPKSLYVEGINFSGTMRDVTLQARLDGASSGGDSATFTILWVDTPVMSFSGPIGINNDKRGNYRNWTAAGTFDLGPQLYTGTPPSLFDDRFGWGSQARGPVHPVNFSYPSNDLKLERDVEFHDWIGNGASTIAQGVFSTFPFSTGQGDTGPPDAMDNNPSPDDSIYDFDAAGLAIPASPQNQIRRTRNNFRAFASITIIGTPVRCSPISSYFIRFSMKQIGAPSGTNWILLSPTDVMNDNQAGAGTTNLSWNLL